MHESGQVAAIPQLKALVVEATWALALLDAPRLEELAVSCDALNRDLDSMSADEKSELAQQAREAQADMSVLRRVLEATRANRNVMRRLREMRERRLEYDEQLIRTNPRTPSETGVGTQSDGDAEIEGDHGYD